MSAGFPVTCPHCGAEAEVKFAASLGHARTCKACGEEFTPPVLDPNVQFAEGDSPPRAAAKTPSLSEVKLWQWPIIVAVTLASAWAASTVVGSFFGNDRAAWKEVAKIAQTTPPGPVPAATEDEARAVGEAAAEAVNAADRAALIALVDGDALADMAFAGLDLPDLTPEMLDGFAARIPGMIADELIAGADGGTAQVLSVIERDGGRAAVVRVVRLDGHAFHFALFPTSDGRIADLYLFFLGMRSSAGARRMAGVNVTEQFAGRGGTNEIQDASAALGRGDAEAVLQLYNQAPKAVRATRNFQSLRVQAAVALGDADRLDAVLADLDSRSPNDSSADFLRIQLLQPGDPRRAVALRRADAAVGGDPFLQGVLAEELVLLGRADEALTLARAAAAAEPELFQTQFGLLSGLIATGDFEGAADLLRDLSQYDGIVFAPEELVELFPRGGEFVASPAYERFRDE